ncbi:M56 family metallopeptidase [Flavobacterium sp. I3-2]|uniref:M56 family metallopeptidase n=1 Tax=Flavobacterium sp. I3-2 TaxID=2748319 RepID=UPI0015B2C2C6|nr:M56 family metallopeptidase [Flavobacterium sp. I3-2]
MILYFIKSTFLLIVFFLIYRYSLQDKKSLKFNRFYLLVTFVLGLILPFLNFNFIVKSNQIIETKTIVFKQLEDISNFDYFPIVEKQRLFSNIEILFSVIALLLLIRIVFRIYAIISLKNSGKKIENEFGLLILNTKVKSPFSFLSCIYLNLESWNKKLIEKEILIHEKGHVVQRHSLDILFIEFLKIGLWFQPMLYFYKKAIQENHEFLADAFCLNQTENIKDYQNIILNYYSAQNKQLELSSSFNYKNLKKRFIMMKNTKKGNVTKVLFYSLAFVLTYFGLVGIETKANTIDKFESVISDKVNDLMDKKTSDEIITDVESIEIEDKIENRKAKPKVEFSIFLNEIQDKIEKYYSNDELENTVHVFFNIDENGKIGKVNILNTNDFLIKDFITKLLEESPNWNPEIKNGIAIQSTMSIPLRIKKSDSEMLNTDLHKTENVKQDFIKAHPKEGIKKFYSHFMRILTVPEFNENIDVKIVLKMVVEEDGNLSNFEFEKPNVLYKELEENIISALKSMPAWNPATQDGKPIASDFYLPINIKVNI